MISAADNTPPMISGIREPTTHGRGVSPRSGQRVGGDVGDKLVVAGASVGTRVALAGANVGVRLRVALSPKVVGVSVGAGVGTSSAGIVDVGACVSPA